MLEEMIVRFCSPTLAGIKTASLFSLNYESKCELCSDVRFFNLKLASKGIKLIPLGFKEGRALIYLYRPKKLKEDLSKIEAKDFLKSCGYPVKNADCCVAKLCKNFSRCREFPHEIGLFLGYPPRDVMAFIENRGECSKCVGTWKVYCDEQNARKTFLKYQKCTCIYCDQYKKGKSIEKLTVNEKFIENKCDRI